MPIRDLNLLLALDALLHEGSVAKAAERMHLSASAMSRSLGRLRETLCDPLLVRAGQGMVLTPRAMALREQVQRVLADMQRVLDTPTQFDAGGLVRTFTIRANEGFIDTFAARLVQQLLASAPNAGIRFTPKSSKDVNALRDGTIDLDIGVLGASGPEVRIQRLFDDRFVGAVRPDHPLASGVITPERYAEGRHISVSRRGLPRGPIDLALQALGLARQVSVIVPGFSSALALARDSGLVASVPARQTVTARAGMHSFPLP
ncbi:MAG TPA: LysR family transcriptional regulator, partial [Dyella sp.]|nr:LysR family transcriptional regulator [Dyella sp.]